MILASSYACNINTLSRQLESAHEKKKPPDNSTGNIPSQKLNPIKQWKRASGPYTGSKPCNMQPVCLIEVCLVGTWLLVTCGMWPVLNTTGVLLIVSGGPQLVSKFHVMLINSVFLTSI
jgi:hypothetical protein